MMISMTIFLSKLAINHRYFKLQPVLSMGFSSQRRVAIKKFVAGGAVVISGSGLPKEWIKPVVDVVLLPVHAQT